MRIVVALVPVSFAAVAQEQQKPLPVVQLIATGGTIAMKIDPVKKAPVPAISGEDLLATVPEIGKVARVEVENLANVPSDYMDPPMWTKLTQAVQKALARPEVAGVIVSHGTDTLEETAYWLDLTVERRSSPEMAGTGAFFTGSIFMAMVPPVAMSRTTGRPFAGSAAAAGQPARSRAPAASAASGRVRQGSGTGTDMGTSSPVRACWGTGSGGHRRTARPAVSRDLSGERRQPDRRAPGVLSNGSARR